MNDDFLEGLAVQWRSGGKLDTVRCSAEIAGRRRRLVRDAALTAVGAGLNIVLAIGFGLWAVSAQSLLVAVSAAAFASAVPVLLSSRKRIAGLLAFAYDESPEAHLSALQASFDDDRRRLGEARACTLILAATAAVAFVLVARGFESSAALVPATAWVVTATMIEAWRFRAARHLRRNQAALTQLRQQAEDSTVTITAAPAKA